ncbi:MAG: glycosyltransferase family 4 protein [Candidatus Nealsonbacteria bacterium]|nr:glycosyltransferase family 4 protein [Candidatus Nealsonbacteria bacterium]
MRILMPVLHYYPVIGGLETWTQNIAERLSPKAEVFVVTSRVADSAKNEVKNGVKIFRTSLFNLGDLSYSSPVHILTALPFIFFKSFLLILSQKIDLLHCQGFLGSCMGYCLSKITGMPYIVTVQRLEEKNFFKKIVYRKANVCIAASSAIQKYFEEIGCSNIEVIPNGVDLKRFENLKKQQKDDFMVMTVARLEKVKGIDYLIGAFARPGLLGRPGLKLLVIGDGSERNNLERLTKELNLEDKVKFVGQIPPEGIPEYLAMADCFVLPSLKEGFGIAVLEAMAAGVPVVASRVGGILDIVEDKKTGLLVEPGNVEDISQSIQRIFQDSALKEQLINNAMTELKRYDWQDIAEKVYKIYQKSIAIKIILAAGIYPPDIGGPATYTERLAKELGSPVISYSRRLKKIPKGIKHFLYFLGLLWLAKGTDVIYTQNVTSAGLPALLAAKLLRKKLILKVVGDAAWEQKKNYLKGIQSYVARGADKIIVPSQYVKRMVKGWGVSEEKIEVIYNAVENSSLLNMTKDEAKRKIGIEGDVILSVGRPVPWKGFDDLRSIMPDLLKENPNFRLVIVGEEKKVPHEQMPFYFKAADMFVLNSGYEGLSHVILEAMSFGVPVIASREGGNPELIEDNFNGFLVEYKNKEQIKQAILKLWRDKELQEKFIKNSREKLEEFSWENLVKKTLQVLKS